MKPRRIPKNPAFRAHAFASMVSEGVWPGENPSRLHRNRVRHGQRVSYDRLAKDPWQKGLWPETEEELAEYERLSRQRTDWGLDDGLPF